MLPRPVLYFDVSCGGQDLLDPVVLELRPKCIEYRTVQVDVTRSNRCKEGGHGADVPKVYF